MTSTDTSNSRLPTLFISHGAPNMALTQNEAREFMAHLGNRYDRPAAIVICSAHFETKGPAVVTDDRPEMIYDFRGFEKELYEIQYPAPGEPKIAEKVASLIETAGMSVERIEKRGFDHGTWVPLSLIYPNAEIPVVQVSIDPDETPDYHYRLGQALASLARQGVLLIGSGNITHNLMALFSQGQNPEQDKQMETWVEEFVSWFDDRMDAGDTAALLNYRSEAPHAMENHPEDDHLLPIFFSLGAAGEGYMAKKIHDSTQFGFLAMDAYEFRRTP